MTIPLTGVLRLKYVAALVALMPLAGLPSHAAADECNFPMQLGAKVLDYYSFCRMSGSPVSTPADYGDDDGPNVTRFPGRSGMDWSGAMTTTARSDG